MNVQTYNISNYSQLYMADKWFPYDLLPLHSLKFTLYDWWILGYFFIVITCLCIKKHHQVRYSKNTDNKNVQTSCQNSKRMIVLVLNKINKNLKTICLQQSPTLLKTPKETWTILSTCAFFYFLQNNGRWKVISLVHHMIL